MIDPYAHNRQAWNHAVAENNEWTRPVAPEVIAGARRGEWEVRLTPTRPVPRAWFGNLAGKNVLGLASGGGQQGPIFAAAGANVTIFDASDAQLAQDRLVAEREGLAIRTVQGDMRNLAGLADASFDLVFNPCSTCFVEELQPVWNEVARVLRPGGALLTGLTNPWFYLFDLEAFDRGELRIAHRLPYRDLDLPPHVLAERQAKQEPLEFSHTLEIQIGGQLQAGLMLTDFFEDTWDAWKALHGVAPGFYATRAVRR